MSAVFGRPVVNCEVSVVHVLIKMIFLCNASLAVVCNEGADAASSPYH